MPSSRSPLRARQALAVAVAAALACAPLVGCTVTEGRAPATATADVVSALGEAGSGVATAELTASLLAAGTLSAAAADTALLDAVRTLEDATGALTTIVPPDAATAADRDDALAHVQEGTALVVLTRAWATARGGPDPAEGERLVAELDDAATGLEELATALEGAS